MTALVETDVETSSYLRYLPAIFQQPDSGDTGVPFLGRFLLAFEKVFADLERTIDRLHTCFEPGGEATQEEDQAPNDFLPWLANWLALSLRQDWDDAQKRRFISRIVSLYRMRGTRAGLLEMLKVYLPDLSDDAITVKDDFPALQVGVSSRVGIDTRLPQPNYFEVTIKIDKPDAQKLLYRTQIARAIIEQQKPAHTYYRLNVTIPTIRIGDESRSRVGMNTFLGASVPTMKPGDPARTQLGGSTFPGE